MSFQVPTYDLTGKVAIITGSTRGIGNAIRQDDGPLRRRGGHHRAPSRMPATP